MYEVPPLPPPSFEWPSAYSFLGLSPLLPRPLKGEFACGPCFDSYSSWGTKIFFLAPPLSLENLPSFLTSLSTADKPPPPPLTHLGLEKSFLFLRPFPRNSYAELFNGRNSLLDFTSTSFSSNRTFLRFPSGGVFPISRNCSFPAPPPPPKGRPDFSYSDEPPPPLFPILYFKPLRRVSLLGHLRWRSLLPDSFCHLTFSFLLFPLLFLDGFL